MTLDQAILALRADPGSAALVRDAYFGPDVLDSARRFLGSGEFQCAARVLGGCGGLSVLDLGAGNGMASYAFRLSGAARVVAVEPDPSDLVGRGAMKPLAQAAGFEISEGAGEALPFADASFDVVYARQVLHHIPPLEGAMAEIARVLKPGGRFLACREHVCDHAGELRRFLAAHPVHRLASNEGAHSLRRYQEAIASVLRLEKTWGPLQSLINAYPAAQDEAGMRELPLIPLRHLGPLARPASKIPGLLQLSAAWQRLRAESLPGRLYSFLARKGA